MKKILQVFKKLFSKKRVARTIYICDPSKATRCSKDGCWSLYRGPCKCTSKKKYAKVDAEGKPQIASDMDMWNEEYMESLLM